MTLIDIIQSDESVAIKIAEHLIKNKFALKVHIDTNKLISENEVHNCVRVYFISKSLLFDEINKEINEKFFTEDLEIYGTPVTNMSQHLGKQLRTFLQLT